MFDSRFFIPQSSEFEPRNSNAAFFTGTSRW